MIPLMKATFAREKDTLAALAAWLATHPTKLSMDVLCLEFERRFAQWQGRKHAVLFNSGSSANLAIIQSLLNLRLLSPGQRVGYSALTWSTNVTPIIQLGLRPIAVDICPSTLNVMSETLLPRLSKLDALFITNALGFLPDLDVIRELCAARRVILIEDNCESLGSALPAGKAGNFGLAASFSFYVAHHMSTIEGGMACTDDDDMAEMLRMVRANGWDRSLTAAQQARWRTRHNVRGEFDAKYTFYVPGYNLRPTEITGFLGLKQLDAVDEALRERAALFAELEAVAHYNPDFVHLRHDHMACLSPFAFPVVCKTAALRDEYVKRFGGAGVEIRPVIAGNIARQPFMQHYKPDIELEGADAVSERGFYFGVYPELTPMDMEVLKSCLRGGW